MRSVRRAAKWVVDSPPKFIRVESVFVFIFGQNHLDGMDQLPALRANRRGRRPVPAHVPYSIQEWTKLMPDSRPRRRACFLSSGSFLASLPYIMPKQMGDTSSSVPRMGRFSIFHLDRLRKNYEIRMLERRGPASPGVNSEVAPPDAADPAPEAPATSEKGSPLQNGPRFPAARRQHGRLE